MTLLKCLILDDEPLAHKVIIEYAKDVHYLEIVAQAYLPVKALQLIKEQTIDLIFLDIKMPKLNGLELLRIADIKAQVIITSAYEEYALESYELRVCDYLLKPFRLDRFIKATDKALENYNIDHSTASSHNKFLLIKSDKRFIQLAKADIGHLESYGNYVKIHTRDQCIITPKTLSSFEKELDHKTFFRIHKSYIVAKSNIAYLEGNMLKLKTEQVLPVSKNYKGGFLEWIAS